MKDNFKIYIRRLNRKKNQIGSKTSQKTSSLYVHLILKDTVVSRTKGIILERGK